MSHDRIAPQLVDYVQRTLDEEARAAVDAHVEQCAACRESLETARELQHLAALGDEALLGHVQAQHLVAYAEERLDDAVRGWVARHVAECEVCSEALSALRAEPPADGVVSPGGDAGDGAGGWWPFLRRTLLAPAPALAYLLLAALLLPLALRGPGSVGEQEPAIRTLPAPVRLFAADRFRGQPGSEPEVVRIEVPPGSTLVHLELVTDLDRAEVGAASLDLVADDGLVLFSTAAGDLIDGAGLARLVLAASKLEPGRGYRVVIRAPAQDPLFESAFLIRRPKSL